MQLDRDVQVRGIFLFAFLGTPCFEILLLLLCWREVMLHHFFYALWLEHIFSMLFEHILFLQWPLSPFVRMQEEKSVRNFGVFIWWVVDMFCVTLGVEVSLCMWVYMILIKGAWNDSTKGHNNLAKLNGSQASICRRFIHWYWHMALVGDMTIEELVLFYFLKRNHPRISPYYEIEQDHHCLTISYYQ
jgi:hypothetical protein